MGPYLRSLTAPCSRPSLIKVRTTFASINISAVFQSPGFRLVSGWLKGNSTLPAWGGRKFRGGAFGFGGGGGAVNRTSPPPVLARSRDVIAPSGATVTE